MLRFASTAVRILFPASLVCMGVSLILLTTLPNHLVSSSMTLLSFVFYLLTGIAGLTRKVLSLNDDIAADLARDPVMARYKADVEVSIWDLATPDLSRRQKPSA